MHRDAVARRMHRRRGASCQRAASAAQPARALATRTRTRWQTVVHAPACCRRRRVRAGRTTGLCHGRRPHGHHVTRTCFMLKVLLKSWKPNSTPKCNANDADSRRFSHSTACLPLLRIVSARGRDVAPPAGLDPACARDASLCDSCAPHRMDALRSQPRVSTSHCCAFGAHMVGPRANARATAAATAAAAAAAAVHLLLKHMRARARARTTQCTLPHQHPFFLRRRCSPSRDPAPCRRHGPVPAHARAATSAHKTCLASTSSARSRRTGSTTAFRGQHTALQHHAASTTLPEARQRVPGHTPAAPFHSLLNKCVSDQVAFTDNDERDGEICLESSVAETVARRGVGQVGRGCPRCRPP